MTRELDHLAQGIPPDIPKGTDTIKCIKFEDIPTGYKCTYGQIVVDIKDNKLEMYRTWVTVRGNLITYLGSVTTSTSELTTIKMLFNSVVSTPSAKFMTIDLEYTLPSPEYMWLPYNIIPDTIKQVYNLDYMVHHGYIYILISKAMYGLPQSGKIAYDSITLNL